MFLSFMRKANLVQLNWEGPSDSLSELPVQIKAETQSPPVNSVVGNNMDYSPKDIEENDIDIAEFLDSILNSSGDFELDGQNNLPTGDEIGNDLILAKNGIQVNCIS